MSNRESMPTIAQWVDQLREHFGKVKVTYAKENGKELGSKSNGIGNLVTDNYPPEKTKVKRK